MEPLARALTWLGDPQTTEEEAPETRDREEYQVLSLLGSGGFGEVYHARKLGAGGFWKDVALKMLNPQMTGFEEVAQRLKDEARVLGLLNHRAIVKVDMLARLGERWTVVMEYVDGADLDTLIQETGPVPLRVALEIGAEVASALDYAYNHDVVDPSASPPCRRPLKLLHRDIKPANLRITPHGDVKVLDFGIARAEFAGREALTGTNVFLTRQYAAPERLRSVEDPAGDVFSLGAVLVELLTGQQLDLIGPYLEGLLQGKAGFEPARYRQRRMAELTEELRRVPGMTDTLCSWLIGMLDWEPERRPPASELRGSLARFAALVRGKQGLGDWAQQVVRPVARKEHEARLASEDPRPSSLVGRSLVPHGSMFRVRPSPTLSPAQGALPPAVTLDEWAVEGPEALDDELHDWRPRRRWPRWLATGALILACLGGGGSVLTYAGDGELVGSGDPGGTASPKVPKSLAPPCDGQGSCISLEGDAEALLLIGESESFVVMGADKKVPEGRYGVRVSWAEKKFAEVCVEGVELPAGDVTLRCLEAEGCCTVVE